MGDEAGIDGADYMEPISDDKIICEGFLRIRSDKGIPGLRPWLLRWVRDKNSSVLFYMCHTPFLKAEFHFSLHGGWISC